MVLQGYAVTALLGALFTSAGVLAALNSLTPAQLAVLIGFAGVVGIMLVALGLGAIRTATNEESKANPEAAVTKTDSRFGKE